MPPMSRLVALALVALSSSVFATTLDAGAPFGELTLIDEIDTGNAADPHTVFEDPAGGSSITQILGRNARSMTIGDDAKVFAYKIGAGKGLVAGHAYLLTVEYPEDNGRQIVLVNRGSDQIRTFSTGQTIGDSRESYTYPSPESLRIPLSQKWETIRTLFYLHEHFQGVKGARNPENRAIVGRPADGFWVAIGQFRKKDTPMDQGAATGRIRLFEVTNPEQYDVAVNFPPSDLPRRHLMWREEMADGVIQSPDAGQNAFTDPLDWYDAKMKTAKFLGVNTFSKDLLEFGYTQDWDPTPGGGNAWFYTTPRGNLWERIVGLAATHEMDVLPYYEYAGAMGGGANGTPSLGKQRRCRPLGDRTNDAYSDVSWSEIACLDVTDPDALADVKELIDATIGRFKTTAPFVGAWFRTRSSNWPVSFSDETIARYNAEKSLTITRAQLKTDATALQNYYAWWFGKRRAYLLAIRDYLRSSVNPDAQVLFTSYIEEALRTPTYADWYTPTDDVADWQTINTQPGVWQWRYNPTDWSTFVSDGKFTEMITRMTPPSADVLMNHSAEPDNSAPPADPQHFKTDDGVYMAMPFSRLFTVSPEALDAFRAGSGLAIVRHFNLNEEDGDNTSAPNGPMSKKVGYFVSDVDRAGPYSMMAEARALANGDPRFIGYLSSNSFNRGFPEYTRAFNAAYLALPAISSTVVDGVSNDAEVVVRRYDTAGHGTYFALVNTALTSKSEVIITLDAMGTVVNLVNSSVVARTGNDVTLSFYPGQVYALNVSENPVPPDGGSGGGSGATGGGTGSSGGGAGATGGGDGSDPPKGCGCSTGELMPLAGLLLGLALRRRNVRNG